METSTEFHILPNQKRRRKLGIHAYSEEDMIIQEQLQAKYLEAYAQKTALQKIQPRYR